MNARLRKLALAAAVVAAGTFGAAALAQGPGYGPGMMGGNGPGYGPGMMGGYGPGGGFGPGRGFGGGPLAALNLTDEQRDKIQLIQEENRQKNWGTMGQLRSEMFKLRRLYYADNADANAVAEQQKKVDELRRQMLKSRLEGRKQVEAVLTPEQRKDFRQYRPWWMQETD